MTKGLIKASLDALIIFNGMLEMHVITTKKKLRK